VDKLNPRDAKVRLAKEIITVYYGSKEAEKQAGEFENIFKKKELPEDILCYQLDFGKLKDGKIWICALLTQAGLSLSNSDARRLIRQGAVSIDNEKISDENLQIIPKDSMVIQSGKRKFVRIKF
jgi:tyrosyl-tRNA synthetase